jgi:uncharacterized protein (TIGR02284 family)
MNTTIREQKIETLNELIAVTRDSAEFYSEAATKVDNPTLSALFNGMADSKNGLVGAMSRDVRTEGAQPADAGTFRGVLHQVYGDVRARLGNDADYAYVSELEETEDRLLGALKDVLKDDDAPAPVKQAVSSYLPKVKEHHDLMRDRKWSMQGSH